MTDVSIETHRSGVFTFWIGADLERLRPLLDKFEYGHRLFTSMPLPPEVVSQVERETLVASIHGTDTLEGGDLSEEEISGAIEASPEISLDERRRRAANLAHYYFERIHPFRDGNGRVGRLLERTLLMSGGYKYPARVLDRYYLEHVDEYFLWFNQAGKAEKTAPDTGNQAFLGFVLGGLAEAVERLHRRAGGLIGRLLVGASLAQMLSRKEINPRQFEILEHLTSPPGRIPMAELKRQTWYRALYRRYSGATEAGTGRTSWHGDWRRKPKPGWFLWRPAGETAKASGRSGPRRRRAVILSGGHHRRRCRRRGPALCRTGNQGADTWRRMPSMSSPTNTPRRSS